MNTLYRIVLSAFMATAGILSSSAINPPADILEAYELCDESDLRPIEGLWSYPIDDVTVLVFRNEDSKGVYDLYVVESADCSLSPGMKLGELYTSTDPNKFNLKLYTVVKNGLLSVPCSAVATFSESKESLAVKKTSVSIKLRPYTLLPSFWRLANISVKSKESAPDGMIKVYPSYDGNGSTRRGPRYL